MGDCDRYLELISTYLDEGIMDDVLKEHLESCPSCKNELNSMESLLSELQSLSEPALPEGFHDRAMQRLALETRDLKPKAGPESVPHQTVRLSRYDLSRHISTVASVILCFILLGGSVTFINRGISGISSDSAPMAQMAQVTEVFESVGMVAGAMESFADLQAAPEPVSGVIAFEAPAPVEAQIGLSSSGEDMVTDFEDTARPVSEAAEPAQSPQLPGSVSQRIFGEEIIPASAGVHADHDHLIAKTFSITITVDDIGSAVTALRRAGYEIESSDISPQWGWGHLALAVPYMFHELAIDQMKTLGETTFEMENAGDLTHATNELAIVYAARSLEAERLTALIRRAERAEDILLLQERISSIERERASLRGSYNQNIESAHNVIVYINLNTEFVTPMRLQRSFSERLGGAFTGSVNFTTVFFEGILVFFSYALVPIVLVSALGGLGYFSFRKFVKRGRS